MRFRVLPYWLALFAVAMVAGIASPLEGVAPRLPKTSGLPAVRRLPS